MEEHVLLYNINMLYTNAFVKYNFNIFLEEGTYAQVPRYHRRPRSPIAKEPVYEYIVEYP